MRTWLANLFRRPAPPHPAPAQHWVECRLIEGPGKPDRMLMLRTPLPLYVVTPEFRAADGGALRAVVGDPVGLTMHQRQWRLVRRYRRPNPDGTLGEVAGDYEPLDPAAHPEEGA